MERIRKRLQHWSNRQIGPLVQWLWQHGLRPNQITVLGFVITFLAAPLLMLGQPVAAGIVFLLGSACDLLDGALARGSGQVTLFGAFLDSTLDRVGEGVVLIALIYYFAVGDMAAHAAATGLTMLGGMLTSYTRARAETLDVQCSGGWVSRPERVIVLGASLILGVPQIAVWILATLTLWTSLQRVLIVRNQLAAPENQ